MPDDHKSKDPPKEIPEIVTEPRTGKKYKRGRFLGKGGFARCYELIDSDGHIFAGKAVHKALLMKKHQKDKMVQEIEIHRRLSHRHVVGFHTHFEDSEFVYVLLELCRKRSLMELHKRRKAITEPEARYFTYQLIDACVYLHGNRVIHRDLKLGNLFLDDNMEVKVGDFGLATKLETHEERKRTLCGTPNYIAPEMLRKAGHSYEVDIWAIGCVLFTLLVGKPPFETDSLKETYIRIKKNDYHIPSRISSSARKVIRDMLAPDPPRRPKIQELLKYDFFCHGYMPERLPTSCLTTAPKFSDQFSSSNVGRVPLMETTNNDTPLVVYGGGDGKPNVLRNIPEDEEMPIVDGAKPDPGKDDDEMSIPADCYLGELFAQLTGLLDSKPSQRTTIQQDEAEDPGCAPVFWVSKWVDYSDKYGLGYQLCDDSVGVLFNDATKLILNKDGKQVQYISKTGAEQFYFLDQYPDELRKKTVLLQYFRDYMVQHLLAAGGDAAPKAASMIVPRLPYLRTWFRTRSAIILHLANGTLQINFFLDHTKIILCPLMQAVTYINENKEFRCYPFKSIAQYGCSDELAQRLRYGRNMCDRLRIYQNQAGSTLPASMMMGRTIPCSQPRPEPMLSQ